ncbi:hypothetical protein LguiB_004270 [Lonicera macranthoides]
MAAKIVLVSIFLISVSSSFAHTKDIHAFSECMSAVHPHLYNPSSPHYTSIFLSSQQNTRWQNLSHRNPAFIFTPNSESEIQRSVICARTHGLQIRVKSGGHDYEGLSFQSRVPYLMLALDNFRAIRINLKEETAWVQTGATLVRVPPIVTTFTVHRRLNESATRLVHQWQRVGEKLPKNILMRLFVRQETRAGAEGTIRVAFSTQFLGRARAAIHLMDKRFPELGVKQSDCHETSWINATVKISSRAKTIEDLLNRADSLKTSYKAKSDFVSTPMPEMALEGLWKRILMNKNLTMIMDPFGGRNSEIPEAHTPFPHRKGNLYNIQYTVTWAANNAIQASRSMRTIRELYKYMEPFVTNSPRAAYINYRDLDVGMNNWNDVATYSRAKVWGQKYFKGNFERLVRVKCEADPGNFFKNEQRGGVALCACDLLLCGDLCDDPPLCGDLCDEFTIGGNLADVTVNNAITTIIMNLKTAIVLRGDGF